jgi:hypothetical protein
MMIHFVVEVCLLEVLEEKQLVVVSFVLVIHLVVVASFVVARESEQFVVVRLGVIRSVVTTLKAWLLVVVVVVRKVELVVVVRKAELVVVRKAKGFVVVVRKAELVVVVRKTSVVLEVVGRQEFVSKCFVVASQGTYRTLQEVEVQVEFVAIVDLQSEIPIP